MIRRATPALTPSSVIRSAVLASLMLTLSVPFACPLIPVLISAFTGWPSDPAAAPAPTHHTASPSTPIHRTVFMVSSLPRDELLKTIRPREGRTINAQNQTHRYVSPRRRADRIARIESVAPGVSARPQILLPLPRQERLLLRVAVLASGDHVPAHGAPPADQRHEMVHREGLGAHLPLAVVTDARRDPPLPPRAPAQLAGARPLTPEVRVGDIGREARSRHHASSLTAESRSDSSSHSLSSQATRSSVSLRA